MEALPEGSDCLIVFVTCASLDEAKKIAQAILERHYAACVNITGEVISLYHWKGALESAAERLLIIKTRHCVFEKMAEIISSIHSYGTPEIAAFPIVRGNEKYLLWLQEECG